MAQRRPADAGVTDPARRALLLAAAVLPACAGTTTPPVGAPAGPVAAPVPRIGDRWQYRVTDRLRGVWIDEPRVEVVEVGDTIRTLTHSRRGGEPTEERFASPWIALVEDWYGVRQTYLLPVPVVPAPLEAGRASTFGTTYTALDVPKPRRWSQRLSTGRWESVEVPAGRFDCLRIDRVITFEAPDEQRRNSSRTDVLWYAPAVGRWIRRDTGGTFISSGLGGANPAEGVQGLESALRWELTAWQRAAR